MNNTEWLKANKLEVSEFGGRVADFVAELFGGIYHVNLAAIKKADWLNDNHISLTVPDDQFSTHDSDRLTRLVILAHKHNVRAGVKASTHGYLKVEFVRVDRGGFFRENHPSLDELSERIKKGTGNE